MKTKDAKRIAHSLIADTLDGLLRSGWPRETEVMEEMEEEDVLAVTDVIDAVVLKLRKEVRS